MNGLYRLEQGIYYFYRIYSFNGPITSTQYSNSISLKSISVITLPITSNSCTSITSGTAIEFEANSNCYVEESGLCWSTSINPTYDLQTHVPINYLGCQNQSLPQTISDLSPGTTYHVRAYAKTGNYIVYGQDVSFVTNFTCFH